MSCGSRIARVSLILLTVLLSYLTTPLVPQGHAPATVAQAQGDVRFFPQTSFRIDNDKFFDFFLKRGGIRTFGFPVSRDFTLLATRVQFFQRRVMQIQPDGSAAKLMLFTGNMAGSSTLRRPTLPSG